MKNTIQSLKKLWKDLGTRRWIFLFFTGVLLVVIAVPVGDHRNGERQDSVTDVNEGNRDGFNEDEGNKAGEQNSYSLQDKHSIQATMTVYEAELENRLTSLLGQIEGAGAVRVMVTISRSSELILQSDISREESVVRESDSQGGTRDNTQKKEDSQTVLTGGGSIAQPYVVGQIMPQLEGVVVACEGGDRPSVQAEISAAVQALFDLAPHKIKVCKMASP